VTGFYFQQGTAYIFDTTGLTLPAIPCGQHEYKGSVNSDLKSLFPIFQKKKINVAVMPVNTAHTLQADPYSCLMATILFFQAMQRKKYQMLEEPGITECYGVSTFGNKSMWHSPVSLFACTYIPLLAGIQSTLGFLFCMDPLNEAEALFEDLVKLRTDWQRKPKEDSHITYNIFWQEAYLKLLTWFAAVHNNTISDFPDFEALCHESAPRKEKSAFEKKYQEFKGSLKNEETISFGRK
jgi:hypothetical protein